MFHTAGTTVPDIMVAAGNLTKNELLKLLDLHSYIADVHTDAICHEIRTGDKPLAVIFNVEIFVAESVRRIDTERNLNDFLVKTIHGDGIISAIELSNDMESRVPDGGCGHGEAFSLTSLLIPPKRYRKVKVSHLLLCRLIKLENEDFNMTESNTIHLLRHDIIVDHGQYEISPDGTVHVCYEYLKKIHFFGNATSEPPSHELERYLWIISLSCTIVSVIFLIISLLIYCLLPVLRTTPGKLIMLLMTSLLFTLTFLQLTSVVAGSDVGCTVVGVILHYSWLTVFTSMQASNFNMYKVFTSTKPRRHSSNVCWDKVMILNVLYSVLIPFIIVALHIAVIAIFFGGSNSYGGRKCFILHRISTYVTFICPIVLICICNLYFFVITARSIHNTPIPEGNERERNEIGIFLRLTSITGLSWLLQVIDSFLPLTAFSFVASSINSLQGFFIFLSFTLNRRNIDLLRNKFDFKTKYTRSTNMSSTERLAHTIGHTVNTKL